MSHLFKGNLETVAIERLHMFEPPAGYYLAYSGGKDSDVILDLAQRSGVKFTAHHALTTADPPEVVRHVKSQPDVEIHRPKRTMWELVKAHHCPPRRQMRYCCQTQKEAGGSGFIVVTGIRWAESGLRGTRKMVEHCLRDKSKRYLHPIIDWTTTDVWDYIRKRGISYCCLYDEGFSRLGCVLCPMVRDVETHLSKWPQICRAWERAIKATYVPGKTGFESAEDYWRWWLDRDRKALPKNRKGWLFT